MRSAPFTEVIITESGGLAQDHRLRLSAHEPGFAGQEVVALKTPNASFS